MKLAKQFMEEHKIMPQKSKQVYYTIPYWIGYCQNRNENPLTLEGQYSVTTLTAHIKISPFITLNYLHEYIGHGSFAEFSRTGEMFAEYESRLIHGEEVRGEYEKLFHEKMKIYEGYALWLESKLAREDGLSNLVEVRHNLIHPTLKRLRLLFDDFEKKNGTKYLIEEVFEA